jgi:signal transduction histidine kinase
MELTSNIAKGMESSPKAVLLRENDELRERLFKAEQMLSVNEERFRRLSAEREQLQQELFKISEREKQLIAQELHDGLCQHLAGTALMGSLLQRRLAARKDDEAKNAAYICELLNTGVNEARNLSHGLHPVKAGCNGLSEALAQLAQTVTRLFHIRCLFRRKGLGGFDNQVVATHLFRISQEAMNNAMKHGQATRVVITLQNVDGKITLSIRDNGCGIPKGPPVSGGMGLQIMRHRTATIGGSLAVRRAGKTGTVVVCTVKAADSPSC